MRTLQTSKPRRELAEFVRIFVQREVRCDGAEFSEPNTASLEQVLAFDFQDQLILEYADGRNSLCPKVNAWGAFPYAGVGSRFHSHSVGFAIFLKPFASWQLFRIPPGAIAGLVFDGGDLAGGTVHDLWEKMADHSAFSDRVRLAEDYLMPFALNALARTSIMKTVQYILHRGGAVRVEELANSSALGVRQYERRFAEEMGLSPKLFTRTARFQMALDAKRAAPNRSWLSIAHAFEYADQMHMIRDFRKLGGGSPTEILPQRWDIQPWSLRSTANVDADAES